METEIEQEGNENAWRTADLRIRKTQVFTSMLSLFLVLYFVACCFCLRPLLFLLVFQKWKKIKTKRTINHRLYFELNDRR